MIEFQKLVKATFIEKSEVKEEPTPDEPLDFNFGHPAMVSQERQFYIGRISCDSLNEGVRLNLTSVILETSKEIGAGCRVKVIYQFY